MPFPFVVIGPTFTVAGKLRDWQQARRKVRLTVHRGFEVVGVNASGHAMTGRENFYLTVTNSSDERDIEITHAWIETEPRLHIHDQDLPMRLRHSARFEMVVPVDRVKGDPELVPWLARVQLSPDDKVIKSRPRENVPDFGAVPRGN
jgi:acetolactate synthase regulatory subunit